MSKWKLDYPAKYVGKWEGFLPEAYLDTIASPPIWTIAFGHTSSAGAPSVHEGDHVSREEGEHILAHDLRFSANVVTQNIEVPLTFRQRMALISAAYNLGPGVIDDLKGDINSGHMKRAANRLLDYDHAGGVVVEGLSRRRKSERWMLLHKHLPNPHRPKPIHPKRKARK